MVWSTHRLFMFSTCKNTFRVKVSNKCGVHCSQQLFSVTTTLEESTHVNNQLTPSLSLLKLASWRDVADALLWKRVCRHTTGRRWRLGPSEISKWMRLRVLRWTLFYVCSVFHTFWTAPGTLAALLSDVFRFLCMPMNSYILCRCKMNRFHLLGWYETNLRERVLNWGWITSSMIVRYWNIWMLHSDAWCTFPKHAYYCVALCVCAKAVLRLLRSLVCTGMCY